MTYQFKIREGECFWGGSTYEGVKMPYDEKTVVSYDFRKKCQNQGMPLFLSNQGRYLWSEDPFAIRFDCGTVTVEGEDDIHMTEAGDCLRDAYLHAMKTHFPFSGKVPPMKFFETAQYNTWMEHTYYQAQDKVLDYAHKIVDNGFKPGILIIDEGWHNPYGDWTFDPIKFPNPRAMVDELHALGFTVMLWVTPFVSPNGLKFIQTCRADFNPKDDAYKKTFMRNEKGEVALTDWWNGYSAILDFENPLDCEYLDCQLRALMQDYGIDGFKFDGGTIGHYASSNLANPPYRGESDGTHKAMNKNIAWNEFGTRYKFHEYKDTFKGGGKPTIQRLADRAHSWTKDDGILSIIPNSLVQGLLGYPFICPDMIGGGEWTYSVYPDVIPDHELFLRMAQVSSLFPMMQFSWAPWRVLNEEEMDIIRESAYLHERMLPEIMKVVEESAVSGEPVLRHLEYEYPHCGYERVTDEFMLGKEFLVCPVVTQGTREKEIVFPEGKWQDTDGNVYECGTHKVKTPLEKLTYFKKIG